jgi:signal transduction histidine kinase/DNA-binding response OmpR family regulator/purine-cytosine permease-like protein
MPSHLPFQVIKERRDYNTWVATESLEDYALRYAPKSFRKWPEFLVANTAIGGISFLALEAIGGSIAIRYGFTNSFWAIVVVGLIIFLAGLPISYYASKYNIDMDLLTRGAGFGYIGSTITSLIYASFTFIFFALEAAIMSQALELYFHLPLSLGYILCSLIIIPLVFFGITLINQLQLWTQPLWLLLMILPYIFVLHKEPEAFSHWLNFAGNSTSGAGFDPLLFGAAATVSFSLIAQLGEQVDYLRFLPEQTSKNRKIWWIAVILAGPGWIFLGGAKQLGGAFLASLAIEHGVNIAKAKEPIQMYLAGFQYIFDNPEVVLAVSTLFVIISQIKINVTNAYAGSLAWSNFFSRLTHSHPGRVVWLVFNVGIALLLMELGVFETLDAVLGLYSNVAIAWIGALVADLVINKPLGLSPSYIEFKRAYLYNVNPVGFGSMLIASGIAIAAFLGLLGAVPQAFSSFIALGIAFILSPVFAVLTKGKYYIARENTILFNPLRTSNHHCCICENDYEPEDMAFCPVYDGHICSLCCSLDARCHDACKDTEPLINISIKTLAVAIFKDKLAPYLGVRFIKYFITLSLIASLTGGLFALSYYQNFGASQEIDLAFKHQFLVSYLQLYAALFVLIGIGTWWFILSEESRQLAQEELDKQNILLQQEIQERLQVEAALKAEIEQHNQTEKALRQSQEHLKLAKEAADAANHAKSEFLANMSHELRTPLNGVLGYAQILQRSQQITAKDRDAARVIYQCGSHLLTLINDVLDLSKIEAQKMELQPSDFHLPSCLVGILEICKIRAEEKKIALNYQASSQLPAGVRADEKRLRQVLINLLGNAIKFTPSGSVTFTVTLLKECVNTNHQVCYQIRFQIEDTGIGMSAEQIEKIFLPFEQVSTAKYQQEGTGLGLAISQKIVQMMGSTIEIRSQLNQGSTFWLDLEIPAATEWVESSSKIPEQKIIGVKGNSPKILIVDDREENYAILVNLLEPLGFELQVALNGQEGIEKFISFQPALIITDLLMPVMDGFEMIEQIRRHPDGKTLPILVSSASVFETSQKRSFEAGSNDFLAKPVQMDELLEKLQTHLNLKWIYQSKSPVPLPQSLNSNEGSSRELNPPQTVPADILETLLRQAKRGHLKGILQQATYLEQFDQQFISFSSQLRHYVKNFQEKELLEFLQHYQNNSL